MVWNWMVFGTSSSAGASPGHVSPLDLIPHVSRVGVSQALAGCLLHPGFVAGYGWNPVNGCFKSVNRSLECPKVQVRRQVIKCAAVSWTRQLEVLRCRHAPHYATEGSCFAVASRRSIPYKELSFDHPKPSVGRASSTVSGDLLVQFQTQKEKRSK